MGTVIDELIVELKLDPKQFDQAAKDQVGKLRQFEREHERHTKKLSSDTEGLEMVFSRLQGRLLAIGSLFTAGMGIDKFTEYITRLTTQTGFLAQSLGLSTAEIAKWQGVGSTVGAGAGEMAQAVAAIRQGQADIQIGRPSGLSAFSYMTHQAGQGPAVDAFDSQGRQRGATEVLMDISRWLQAQKERGPDAVNNATRTLSSMLGMGQGTINTLMLGPEELQKRLKDMEKYAPTEQQVKRLTELQQAFGKLTTSAEALGREIVTRLEPSLMKIVNFIQGIVDAGNKIIDTGQKVGGTIMGGPLGVPFDLMGKGFGAAKSVWDWGRGKLGFGEPPAAPPGSGQPSGPGGAGGGTRTQTAPGVGANDNVGAGLGGSDFLRARRERFAREINADPALRREVAGMMVLEGARDPGPVVESLFNRSDYTGRSLRRSLHNGFYGPINRGELPGAMARLDRDPRLRERMDRAIDGALAGSNVIRGYTDQGLPTDPNGMHFPQMRRGGNVFTDWGGGPGGHAGARRYREMITEGVNRESTAPRLPGAEAGSGTFDQMWSNRIGTLGGAGAALRSGGSPVTNNSRSSETNIGNMNVTVPPGADPAGYARGISQELERYDNVMNANEGLL